MERLPIAPLTTLRRVLLAVVAVVFLICGYFLMGGAFHSIGSSGGLIAAMVAVFFLTLSAVAAHAARWMVLEAIVGAFVLVLAGMLILGNLTESSSPYAQGGWFNVGSIATVLVGGAAYALYRRRVP